MVNHMAEVARLLGVELGEPFKVTDDTYGAHQLYHRFTESAGIEISDDGVTWERAKAVVLKCLLMGDGRIVKLPRKPAIHDSYYYPLPSDKDLWGCCIWTGNSNDISKLERGLIFKTKEEAAEVAKKMLAVAKEGKNNG